MSDRSTVLVNSSAFVQSKTMFREPPELPGEPRWNGNEPLAIRPRRDLGSFRSAITQLV